MTWNEVVQMSLLQMSFAGAVMILAVIVIRAGYQLTAEKDLFGALGNSGRAVAAPVLCPLCA